MKLANEEDLKNLKIGTPVLVNIADTVSDIGLFLSYDLKKKQATILDCYSKDTNNKYKANICNYSRVILLETSEDDLQKLNNI